MWCVPLKSTSKPPIKMLAREEHGPKSPKVRDNTHSLHTGPCSWSFRSQTVLSPDCVPGISVIKCPPCCSKSPDMQTSTGSEEMWLPRGSWFCFNQIEFMWPLLSYISRRPWLNQPAIESHRGSWPSTLHFSHYWRVITGSFIFKIRIVPWASRTPLSMIISLIIKYSWE